MSEYRGSEEKVHVVHDPCGCAWIEEYGDQIAKFCKGHASRRKPPEAHAEAGEPKFTAFVANADPDSPKPLMVRVYLADDVDKYLRRPAPADALPIRAEQKAADALMSDDEYVLRKFIAISHEDGKCHIYGDDGELQCNDIVRHGRTIDFRREPIRDLLSVIYQTRLKEYAKSQRAALLDAGTEGERWWRDGQARLEGDPEYERARAALDAGTEGPGLAWVRIQDRLPSEGEYIIAKMLHGPEPVMTGYWVEADNALCAQPHEGSEWQWAFTHWMPVAALAARPVEGDPCENCGGEGILTDEDLNDLEIEWKGRKNYGRRDYHR